MLTKDGEEKTISVGIAEGHKEFHLRYGINDIGIVFLIQSVEFTGE